MILTNKLPSGTARRGMAHIQAHVALHGAKDLRITVRVGQQTLARVEGLLGVYGVCLYPSSKADGPKTYRITLNVPGPFPIDIRVHRPPVYFVGKATPSPGCTLGEVKRANRRGTVIQWAQQCAYARLGNVDEGLVWIFGHEWYHYMVKSKRLTGRNDEIQADAFAGDLLAQFRGG